MNQLVSHKDVNVLIWTEMSKPEAAAVSLSIWLESSERKDASESGIDTYRIGKEIEQIGWNGWGRGHNFSRVGDFCTICQVFVRDVLEEQKSNANSKCFVLKN